MNVDNGPNLFLKVNMRNKSEEIASLESEFDKWDLFYLNFFDHSI
jgi:hypothetical protein